MTSNLTNWQPPILPNAQHLEGQYVRLEYLSAQDHATNLFNNFKGHDDVWLYLPDEPFREFEPFQQHIASLNNTPEQHYFYAIFDKETQKWGGFASYWTIQPDAGSIELGYISLSPTLQRTRAATEAFYLIMKWAFEAGYRRFEWKCDSRNMPSRRAAQRLGLSYEGIFRQASVVKGQNRDTAWFAAIDKEWSQLNAAFEQWLSPANFTFDGRQLVRLSSLTAPVLVATDPILIS
ncbi:GNAT family N-acetyltransferase [Parasulfitobacter algicola]|uniref:GNAT family N-acetyltransferase n=1 Tax=Parasulfitobacter algicola TaxID=2614809 RepID=A0ABX2J075_9RHOB|nr:GNAT family protein [Sulfitobacter algicola]NSX56108.1 GNAT family N-acetyltransferase [Sulfitobacter algicola]